MSKRRNPRRAFLLIAALFLLSAAAAVLIVFGAARAPQTPALPAPAASSTLRTRTDSLASTTLDTTFDEHTHTLSCAQETVYVNRTSSRMDRVQLRLYPNAFKRVSTTPVAQETFSAGELFIRDVRVKGRAVPWAVSGSDETVLDIPLTLSPGETCTLFIDYTVSIPQASWRFGESDGVLLFGNALAVPSVWEDGRFRDDAYGAIGDPFYQDSQNIFLRLTLPQGWTAAVSGALRAQDDLTSSYECLGVRDAAFALSRTFHTAQALHGDTLVSVYARNGKNAQSTLSTALRVLDIYEALFETAYPYPTLTLVQGDLGDYGGMEYSGYAVIGDASYQTGRDALELVIAHEIAHQWFGALVGSDQITAPWLDEAMSEYASMLYIEKARGTAAFEQLYAQRVEPALRVTRPFGVTTGAPLDVFMSLPEYAQTVYQRGAGMLHGIREAVGLEAFCRFIHVYIDRYAFENVDRDGFAGTLREATGSDWTGYLNDYLDG